ncbi:MAG: folylpolyglutamate synthase/dihydrofolate synthase family protein [Candidatus Omnitrophota bacterium]|nr:folylpolyglutamate synthase/dihydrofolate synthase family protein [Candidatus Omnitrophota bacterium]
MTYPETVQYLESFVNYEQIPVYPYKESFKLERVKNFLARIDNPQDSLKCLHIAGTKGKGSTCAFVAYILRQAGYRVGLYTSPHLSDFRERIRILHTTRRAPYAVRQEFEGMISRDELVALIGRLMPAIEEYNQSSEYGPLTFFEVYTSLAFLYFKEKKAGFAVLETGMGGRLDATNVVNTLVAAITPISYEHTQKLGNTLEEIAKEKAGIIKSSCQLSAISCQPIVITAPQEKEAREVIMNRCREVGAKLYTVNKDMSFKSTKKGFSIKGIFGEYPDLKIRLLGRHQLINAAVAVGIIEALRFYNIIVDVDSIRAGLYNTIWPGRCEVVSSNPLIVLDGAQNIASMRALKEAIKENFSAASAVGGKGGKYKRLILVLGISSDKDVKGICNEIYDLADEIVLTKADNPRAAEPENLVKYFNGKEVHITDNVKEAKALACRLAVKKDLILVCGSLFVVGEFRNVKMRY